MKTVRNQLKKIFGELDQKIRQINVENRNAGILQISNTEVKLLGQMSLLANDDVSLILSLACNLKLWWIVSWLVAANWRIFCEQKRTHQEN